MGLRCCGVERQTFKDSARIGARRYQRRTVTNYAFNLSLLISKWMKMHLLHRIAFATTESTPCLTAAFSWIFLSLGTKAMEGTEFLSHSSRIAAYSESLLYYIAPLYVLLSSFNWKEKDIPCVYFDYTVSLTCEVEPFTSKLTISILPNLRKQRIYPTNSCPCRAAAALYTGRALITCGLFHSWTFPDDFLLWVKPWARTINWVSGNDLKYLYALLNRKYVPALNLIRMVNDLLFSFGTCSTLPKWFVNNTRLCAYQRPHGTKNMINEYRCWWGSRKTNCT